MAESLSLGAATESNRCTVCHAPLALVPAANLARTADVTEGVSCENCHNAASSWLRSHTRPDWTYADRVHAGIRDMRSAYVRATTCASCHQVIDADLLKAGHPELTFELDGQTASEPRHWTERGGWSGGKAWFVGQAAALRDISRRLAKPDNNAPDLMAQEHALIWLLSDVRLFKTNLLAGQPAATISPQASPDAIADWSDNLARTFSGFDWKPTMSAEALTGLAAASDSFLDDKVPNPEREMRAERLVLGLDRLTKSANIGPAERSDLTALFADVQVQDRNQFDAKKFAEELHQFADALAARK